MSIITEQLTVPVESSFLKLAMVEDEHSVILKLCESYQDLKLRGKEISATDLLNNYQDPYLREIFLNTEISLNKQKIETLQRSCDILDYDLVIADNNMPASSAWDDLEKYAPYNGANLLLRIRKGDKQIGTRPNKAIILIMWSTTIGNMDKLLFDELNANDIILLTKPNNYDAKTLWERIFEEIKNNPVTKQLIMQRMEREKAAKALLDDLNNPVNSCQYITLGFEEYSYGQMAKEVKNMTKVGNHFFNSWVAALNMYRHP